jgi:hypothetical protein
MFGLAGRSSDVATSENPAKAAIKRRKNRFIKKCESKVLRERNEFIFLVRSSSNSIIS